MEKIVKVVKWLDRLENDHPALAIIYSTIVLSIGTYLFWCLTPAS